MLSLHKNDVQSVAVGVSKLDYNALTLIDPRVKINEIGYWKQWLASAKTGAYVRFLASSETVPVDIRH